MLCFPYYLGALQRLSLISASYPDVSLSMKMCAQRKARRRQQARLNSSHGPFRFITSRSPLPGEKRKRLGRRLGLFILEGILGVLWDRKYPTHTLSKTFGPSNSMFPLVFHALTLSDTASFSAGHRIPSPVIFA